MVWKVSVSVLRTGKHTLRHLEAFFTALAANGLAINLEKCVFATPSLEILVHKISVTGAAPTADHAAEIKKCPSPQDIKQLQHFLGMVNFYRCFLPNFAQVLQPLSDLPGLKRWNGPFPPRGHSKMLNVSWRWQYHSNILHQTLSFPWPLTPPILISEGSCNKNQKTIGGHLVSFPQTNRHRIPLFNFFSCPCSN
jgi:hypothetical protein